MVGSSARTLRHNAQEEETMQLLQRSIIRATMLLLIFLAARTNATTDSTISWVSNPSTGRNYVDIGGVKRMVNCEKKCREIGGSMPCVRDEEESSFIAKNVAHNAEHWVGLYQAGLCRWKWTSRECASNFESWDVQQPDNNKQRENCVKNVFYSGYNATSSNWHDISCVYGPHATKDEQHTDWELKCICEKDLSTSKAFLQWDGPVLHYGLQGNRNARDASYTVVIILSLFTPLVYFASFLGVVGINPDTVHTLGHFGAFFGIAPGFFYMSIFFSGDFGTTCEDEYGYPFPFSPFETAGWYHVGIGLLCIFTGPLVGAHERRRIKKKVEDAAKRLQERRAQRTSKRGTTDAVKVDAEEYTQHVAETNRTVEDAITGNKLDVDTQTILIGVDTSGAVAENYVPINRTIFASLIGWCHFIVVDFVVMSPLVYHELFITGSLHFGSVFAFVLFCYAVIVCSALAWRFFLLSVLLRIGGGRRIRLEGASEIDAVEGRLSADGYFGKLYLDDGTRTPLFYWLFSNWRTTEIKVLEKVHVGQVKEEYSKVEDVKQLLQLLLDEGDDAPPILIRAKAGTGKTWSARQLIRQLAITPESRVVPLLIYVQQLSRDLRKLCAETGKQVQDIIGAKNLVEIHLDARFRTRSPKWYNALLEAFHRRELLVVLDGIDEASDLSQHIEKCIFEHLVQEGHRVVATSRYEGVRLDDRYQDFVVLDLKPLSDEQQRDVIRNQLGDNEYFQHLMAFSKIRTKHDQVYAEEAFKRNDEKKYVEGLAATDKFKIGDDLFDPSMRTTFLDGSPVGINKGELKSNFLKNTSFDPSILEELDNKLRQLPESAQETEVEECALGATGLLRDDDQKDRKSSWLKKLAKLAIKRGLPSSLLWPQICSRTDECYVVAEQILEDFNAAAAALLRECGMDPSKALIVGPIKDPIRVVEKAKDDYEVRFTDGVIAESCVADILRARAVVSSGHEMRLVQKYLMQEGGFECQVNGKSVSLEMIRLKNKFQQLDPTHFRNILNNLRLCTEGKAFFVELQTHHEKILRHNDDSYAHAHYDYFRAKLADTLDEKLTNELDFVIETTIKLFEEVVKVPVLLSMLAVVLGAEAFNGEQQIKFPSSVYDLYARATAAVIEQYVNGQTNEAVSKDDIERCLRVIAYKNHLSRNRVFTSEQAMASLEGEPALLNAWRKIMHNSDRNPPLVKVLTMASPTGEGGEYQFSHLSFQEYFFVEAFRHETGSGGLPPGFRWETTEDKINFFRDKFMDNVTRLGATVLAEKLFSGQYGTELSFIDCFSDAVQIGRLFRVISEPNDVQSLTIHGCSIDSHSFELLGRGMGRQECALTSLSLEYCGIDDSQLKALLDAGALHSNLKHLSLASNNLRGFALETFLKFIRTAPLETLDVCENEFCSIVRYLNLFSPLETKTRGMLGTICAEQNIKLSMWKQRPENIKGLIQISVVSVFIVFMIWAGILFWEVVMFVLMSVFLTPILEQSKLCLGPLLAYDKTAPLWLPSRPAVEHPLFKYGKLLHLALYPLTVLLSCIEWILLSIESKHPILVYLLGFGFIALQPIWILCELYLQVRGCWSYEKRQHSLDNSIVAIAPSNVALGIFARIGPKATYFAVLIFGCVPSGNADGNLGPGDPGYDFEFALARSFLVSDARTAAVLLYCAPAVTPENTFWSKYNDIHDRKDLMRWVAEKILSDAMSREERPSMPQARPTLKRRLSSMLEMPSNLVQSVAHFLAVTKIEDGLNPKEEFEDLFMGKVASAAFELELAAYKEAASKPKPSSKSSKIAPE